MRAADAVQHSSFGLSIGDLTIQRQSGTIPLQRFGQAILSVERITRAQMRGGLSSSIG
jgi:hypothetical protein